MATSHHRQTQVPVEHVDSFALFGATSPGGKKEFTLYYRRKQADDDNAIREADKPALLKAARAELPL